MLDLLSDYTSLAQAAGMLGLEPTTPTSTDLLDQRRVLEGQAASPIGSGIADALSDLNKAGKVSSSISGVGGAASQGLSTLGSVLAPVGLLSMIYGLGKEQKTEAERMADLTAQVKAQAEASPNIRSEVAAPDYEAQLPEGYAYDSSGIFVRNTNDPNDYNYYLYRDGKIVDAPTPPLNPIPKPEAPVEQPTFEDVFGGGDSGVFGDTTDGSYSLDDYTPVEDTERRWEYVGDGVMRNVDTGDETTVNPNLDFVVGERYSQGGDTQTADTTEPTDLDISVPVIGDYGTTTGAGEGTGVGTGEETGLGTGTGTNVVADRTSQAVLQRDLATIDYEGRLVGNLLSYQPVTRIPTLTGMMKIV